MVTIDKLQIRGRPAADPPPPPSGGDEGERLRATIREVVREELERLSRLEAR